ncbi:hypothetical protein [Geobacter sp.]|uniref:hypothetical protein n=1 Tax=Geobacter sp. TaxID=46610 RepID=UPI00261020E3|nr:hypothetical protein [Geobacter sp.]
MTNESLEGQMTLFGTPQDKPQKIERARKAAAGPVEKGREPRTTPRKKGGKDTSPARTKGTRKETRSLSGLVPEGDVRLTANIREDLHLRLKIAAARQRTTIGELIELMVKKYIK